ncbi:MAG: hypothetical protein ACPGFC_10480 [Paracoccaceae bacterium]
MKIIARRARTIMSTVPAACRRLLRATLGGIVGAVMLATPGLAQDFKGEGWTHSFKANCGMPVTSANDPHGRPRSIIWAMALGTQQLAFRLNPGDMGGCRSDQGRFNGASYWERAEIRQIDTLRRGLAYRIQFDAIFAEGYAGTDEHFFQVAGWAPECRSSPLIKLLFDKGRMEAKVLKSEQDPFNMNDVQAKVTGVTVAGFGRSLRRLKGEAHSFVVDLDMRGPKNTISVNMDGQVLVREQSVHVANCVSPYVKLGLFRPGGVNRSKSTLVVDNVGIFRLR